MSSTGMAFNGKNLHVSWNGTVVEHAGECALPATTDNETVELETDLASRKEIIQKKGWQPVDINPFFKPEVYETFVTAKEAGSLGTLSYAGTASDGGTYNASFLAKVVTVGEASADVEGLMESFSATIGIIKRLSGTGASGTEVFD